ncbi:CynX/NimT family MFS transporter [Moritella sp. 24]|uniref:CynX/NimT family MFS transporter n=1 Tax=Moritella sp. 24 TaxID=2746230 RepID=UPI001BA82C4A|nr:CynX/NimT family MFS transporter [Moritella sp. 24]QUM75564.1 CynX/NimT family MFS transporter [Moritella sp. 24]
MPHNNKPNIVHPVLVIMSILLIASNLRGPITGIGPILEFISHDLALSATQAGMLTTLPLLAFALFSPLSSGLARKIGLEPSLMLALVAITSGIVIRSAGSTVTLFLGTCIIGVGIAIGNVLLPSLLKRDFPKKVPTLTAIYVLIMGIGATISASTTIPLLNAADTFNVLVIPNWAFALAGTIVLPIITMLVWLPQMKRHTKPTADTAEIDSHSYLWRSITAWQVTGFLALNSFIMYSFIAWLPSILVDNGYSNHQAGYIHGILQLASAAPAIILIPLMGKMKDKRGLSLAMTLLALVGITGLLTLPQYAVLWVGLLGFSCGGGFILGLSFVGLRTHNAHQAAALSGMAQCMGYLFAASGPLLFGSLHEATGSWNIPLIITAGISIIWASFAMLAGRTAIITPPINMSNNRLNAQPN